MYIIRDFRRPLATLGEVYSFPEDKSAGYN